MPANTSMIFPLTPNVGSMGALLTTAMTNTKAFDGTETVGTAKALVLTAGANGARVDNLRVQLGSKAGAAASGTTNATLVRFWLNNGSSDTTAANNQLIGEIPIAAATVTALGTTANPVYDFPLCQPFYSVTCSRTCLPFALPPR